MLYKTKIAMLKRCVPTAVLSTIFREIRDIGEGSVIVGMADFGLSHRWSRAGCHMQNAARTGSTRFLTWL